MTTDPSNDAPSIVNPATGKEDPEVMAPDTDAAPTGDPSDSSIPDPDDETVTPVTDLSD